LWLALIGLVLAIGTKRCGRDRSHAFRANPASSDAEASNPENAFEVRVDGGGVELSLLGGDAQRISLAISRLARGAAVLPLESGALRIAGTRAELHRLEGALVEWYVNEARGLEQGFTLRDGRSATPRAAGAAIALAGRACSRGPTPAIGLASDLSGAVKLRSARSSRPTRPGDRSRGDARGRAGLTYRVDDRGARIDRGHPLARREFHLHGRAAAPRRRRSQLRREERPRGRRGTFSSTPAQAGEGGVWVYLGGASGIDPTPDWVGEGDQANAGFGYAVASASDVNGDGCDDLLVGAPFFSNGQNEEGAAFLFLGIQDRSPSRARVRAHGECRLVRRSINPSSRRCRDGSSSARRWVR
jgi:hypothetical protein